MDRRRFLQNSAITAATALSPMRAFAQAKGGPTLSRQLARWVAGLRYEDLPAPVVDRAKGVTLQALASVLVGSQLKPGREAVNLINEIFLTFLNVEHNQYIREHLYDSDD